MLRIACAALHWGEEPPVSGTGGSGTVFFSGCSLKCTYCQNYQISRLSKGSDVSIVEFARICLALQNEGAENINLVTGTHFIPSIAVGLAKAKEGGLSIPVVWNSSGYEDLKALEIIHPFIDSYLLDVKTLNQATSGKLCSAPNYPYIATRAAVYAAENLPYTEKKHILQKGLIVRHLVLPGKLHETRSVIKWFGESLKDRAKFSLMFQYTTVETEKSSGDAPKRGVNSKERNAARQWLERFGIDNGFVQTAEPTGRWLPDFEQGNSFPSEFARTIWHWKSHNENAATVENQRRS